MQALTRDEMFPLLNNISFNLTPVLFLKLYEAYIVNFP
jgi:hypothetical protein